MFLLWKHILRAHAAPFVFSVLVLMAIFILQFIMKFMDQLVGKGLSAGVIVQVIVFNLAWMLVLAVPMSVLVATLMAFGGLSSANEITAMRASGVSLYRMIAPPFAASIVIGVLLVFFNNDVLPDMNLKAKVLSWDIYKKRPTLSIVPGLFSQDITGYTILVRKTFERTNELEGVTIFDHTRPDVHATITARRGEISFSPDYRKLIMDLYHGEIDEINAQTFTRYRSIKFQKHRIAMNAEGFDFQRSQETTFSRGDRELSASAMQIKIDSLERLKKEMISRVESAIGQDIDALLKADPAPVPQPGTGATGSLMARMAGFRNTLQNQYYLLKEWDRNQREYMVEIHKKYAIPAACVIFILVGAPLGIMSRRGTFGVAASLSLGFFLLYWACLIGGEKLADRGFLHPWVGMWSANILLGLLGSYLTFRTARESLTIDWSRLRRFVPKSWRIEQPPEENP